MVQKAVFDSWADLLRYPNDGGAERIRQGIGAICATTPELEEDLRPMLDYASSRSESDLEEVFTRTFDSNAERALEVGWHIHGENYARGAFMVRMRQLLRDHGIEERSELPDHLSHVLPVLARAKDELAGPLARGVVVPALDKIEDGFSDESNPYFGVVAGLRKFVQDGYGEDRKKARDE